MALPLLGWRTTQFTITQVTTSAGSKMGGFVTAEGMQSSIRRERPADLQSPQDKRGRRGDPEAQDLHAERGKPDLLALHEPHLGRL